MATAGAPAPARVVGAVLCGGASRRMGRDKALIEVDGVALARRVADALIAGGCDEVLAVGGDAGALADLGLTPVPDRWAGEGPLGGLATALSEGASRGADALVLTPCDLLDPSAEVVVALLAALDDAATVDGSVDVAAGEVDDRVEWILSAWRPSRRLADRIVGLVESGARRLDAVAPVVRRVAVPGGRRTTPARRGSPLRPRPGLTGPGAAIRPGGRSSPAEAGERR